MFTDDEKEACGRSDKGLDFPVAEDSASDPLIKVQKSDRRQRPYPRVPHFTTRVS
jgi:hypothetical protein